MLERLPGYLGRNVIGLMALFVALGGTAYAVNTVNSTDIVDGQVKSVDVGDGEILSADVKDQSLTTFDVSTFLGADVVDGTLTSEDIKDFSLGNGDFLDGSVDSRVVTNNSLLSSDLSTSSVGSDEVTDSSLTGTDINESTLNLPQTPTTGTFAFTTADVTLQGLGVYTQVLSKSLPAGSWAVVSTVEATTYTGVEDPGDLYVHSSACQLRNGSNVIGGTRDSRTVVSISAATASMTMNGGAQVPSGGGNVSVWCRATDGGRLPPSATGQLMVIRLDGFS